MAGNEEMSVGRQFMLEMLNGAAQSLPGAVAQWAGGLQNSPAYLEGKKAAQQMDGEHVEFAGYDVYDGLKVKVGGSGAVPITTLAGFPGRHNENTVRQLAENYQKYGSVTEQQPLGRVAEDAFAPSYRNTVYFEGQRGNTLGYLPNITPDDFTILAPLVKRKGTPGGGGMWVVDINKVDRLPPHMLDRLSLGALNEIETPYKAREQEMQQSMNRRPWAPETQHRMDAARPQAPVDPRAAGVGTSAGAYSNRGVAPPLPQMQPRVQPQGQPQAQPQGGPSRVDQLQQMLTQALSGGNRATPTNAGALPVLKTMVQPTPFEEMMQSLNRSTIPYDPMRGR